MAPVCPRDLNELAPKPDALGPGTTALECVRCAGTLVEWKSAQGLFAGLGAAVADLQTLVKQAQAKPRRSEPPPCTACGKGAMQPFSFKGTELDLCTECGAVWLDRGELSRITKGKLGAEAPTAPKPVAGLNERVVGIYEMLWDCGYCGTKELLGQTHRFCPKCGAAQDASARYFPPEGKEVAASAEYDGVDRECPACKTPNGAKAVHCRQCGSPMDGSQRVAQVADRVSSAPRPAPPSGGGKKRRWWPWVLGAAAALSCGFCGLAVFWEKDVAVEVQGHSWERRIDIEQYAQQSESAWCDSKPSDAYDVSRHREQRSTKSIPDGEECSTRDVDRGNGTFERRKECRTKYREEPVYDDRCSYHVNRWGKAREEKAAGAGLSPEPRWPAVSLRQVGASLGSEREGARHESYSLSLKGGDGKVYSCTLPEARWRAVADGFRKTIKVGVITGAADCNTL